MRNITTKDIGVLWKEYSEGKDGDVRDELIVHYLSLVKFAVGRISANLPAHIKVDDLYSSGVTGLIKAVEKFDLSKNNKFETYAIFLIKGAIIDELRKLDWVPRSIHQKANLITQAQQALQQNLGRDPTDSELSLYLGLTEVELDELLERVRPAILIPLDAERANLDDETTPLLERLADAKAELSSEVLERKEFSALLANAVADLPEQERQVLVLYYYEELMLKEIGKILGISESRVSQIHTKALIKLRGRLKSFADDFAQAIAM